MKTVNYNEIHEVSDDTYSFSECDDERVSYAVLV